MSEQSSLVVVESDEDDSSVVFLRQKKMDELGLFRGDTVLLMGKRGRKTVAIAMTCESCSNKWIMLHHVVRYNLRVRLGDSISLTSAPDLVYGQRICVLPIDDTIEGFAGSLFEEFLKPYFMEAYRPLYEGDIFAVKAEDGRGTMHTRTVEFKVISTKPSPSCIVAPDTVINYEGEAIKRENQRAEYFAVGYDEIGGLGWQMQQIKEVLDTQSRHSVHLRTLGINDFYGMLLHGPPGTGKTLIGQAVPNEKDRYVRLINGAEIAGNEAPIVKLRTAFDDCEKHEPSVLFIDELDAIAAPRNGVAAAKHHLAGQLCALLDGLHQRGSNIVVIGATNRLDSIEPALRRFGRFAGEIEIGLPDEAGRLEVLQVHTRQMPLNGDVELKKIASECNGYSGADLASLCAEAGRRCVRENAEAEDDNDDARLSVSMAHFRAAMRTRTRTDAGVTNNSCVTHTTVIELQKAVEDLSEKYKRLLAMVARGQKFTGESG